MNTACKCSSLSLCLLVVLGLRGFMVQLPSQRLLLLYRHEYHTLRCMAFSMSTGCIGFVKYCGKMYSCHLYTTAVVTVQGWISQMYMAFSMSTGRVGFARHCGRIYSHHLLWYAQLYGFTLIFSPLSVLTSFLFEQLEPNKFVLKMIAMNIDNLY